MIIDGLAIDWKDYKCYQTLCRCSRVCKTWSQRALRYLNSTVSIHSVPQLLQYAKAKHPSYCLVQTLHVFITVEDGQRYKSQCSVIGSTLLLISKLSNLQELYVSCNWYNDHHPQMLKFLSNNSIKTLHCTFVIHTNTIQSIFKFITCFRSLRNLSLHLFLASPLKSHSKPFQRALPKTEITLKELHLYIYDDRVLKLVSNAFIGAKGFVSHLRKHSYEAIIHVDTNEDSVRDYQNLLLNCSDSLQVLSVVRNSNPNYSLILGKLQPAVCPRQAGLRIIQCNSSFSAWTQ